MNRIAILLASISLVSCSTKPWMVGSLQECDKPARVPGGIWTKDFVSNQVVVEEAPVYDSGKYSKNPLPLSVNGPERTRQNENPLPLNMGGPFRNL